MEKKGRGRCNRTAYIVRGGGPPDARSGKGGLGYISRLVHVTSAFVISPFL